LWQKKWSGHGRTGRTADYGPALLLRSIDISWLTGPQQQTDSSDVRRPGVTDEQMDGLTQESFLVLPPLLCG